MEAGRARARWRKCFINNGGGGGQLLEHNKDVFGLLIGTLTDSGAASG